MHSPFGSLLQVPLPKPIKQSQPREGSHLQARRLRAYFHCGSRITDLPYVSFSIRRRLLSPDLNLPSVNILALRRPYDGEPSMRHLVDYHRPLVSAIRAYRLVMSRS